MDNGNDLFRETPRERAASPEQLGRYIKIVTPSIVIVLIALVFVIAGAAVWAGFGSIPVTMQTTGAVAKNAQTNDFEVVCVVDIDESSEMAVGMEVQVSPVSFSRDEYGFIYGKVTSVSRYPTSLTKLEKWVGDSELAQYLMPASGGMLVSISLEPSSESQNGLMWSHKNGESANVTAGMLCDCLFLIKEVKPLDMILGGAMS